jgi:hypothetical protein
MSKTYPGILRRNRIEWKGRGPEGLSPDQAVDVQVTIVGPPGESLSPAERGRRMREALEAAARAGGFPGAPDGVEWQREIRRDRPLPGRDD